MNTLEQFKDVIESDPYEKLKIRVMQFLAMRNRESKSNATELIAQYVLRNFTVKTTRDDNNSEVWWYNDGIYLPEGKSYIQEICRDILQTAFTTQLVNETIAKISADTFVEQEDFFNIQNDYYYLIPLQNGVLNIKTKELEQFSPEIPFFNKLPMQYDANKDCNTFLNFLNEIFEDKDCINVIQELFGFCMLKQYRYEKSFMFEGKGRNGKSKLISVLKEFLGVSNCANISLLDIEKNQFILSSLHNKLVNICSEISHEALNNSGNFKSITGRDQIQADRKFKTPIQFENYAKMIFAGNELPYPKDNSSAFWQRWVLINFPFQFLPQKELDCLDEKDKTKVKLQNPSILDNLTTPDELSGILNWALEGFKRLETNKDFSNNKSADQTKTEWMRKANSVIAFVNDHIKSDYDSCVVKSDFKKNYLMYCQAHKVKPLSDKVIKIALENELGAYHEQKYIRENDESKRLHVWSGISYNQGNQDNQGISVLGKNIFSPGSQTPKFSTSRWLKGGNKDTEIKNTESNISFYHKCKFCKSTKNVKMSSKNEPICEKCEKDFAFDDYKIGEVDIK
jgi:putative DNA primase/helicase